MWLTHMDSEVNKFHPVCEKALIAALKKINKDSDYKVLHHEYTGSLEMDFVIQNVKTGRYLCVVEVKRTPADVHSARYQSQAMSYVSESSGSLEKPFYVLTNLEYALLFRYDPFRPRVVQQILEPGLVHVGDFSSFQKEDFIIRLTDFFADMISKFLSNDFNYLVTLEQFERHMKNISNNAPKWKSSLVILLYEYIRGAFLSIGRADLPYDVRIFQNNIERICEEAVNVNFKEIFSYSSESHEKTTAIANDILASIFEFGKQNISGDTIAAVLHSIISADREHSEGEVPTDLELARVVALLAKCFGDGISDDEYICDPAAGSGNLISSAIEIFNVLPKQIKANDINEKLLELLSLRLGLDFAKVVSFQNSVDVTASNIVDLPAGYFEKIKVIVMNPPFVAGINCTDRKKELFKKIREMTHKDAKTNVGQMNLEGAFLEMVCSSCNAGTIISCVLPKTHLAARGKEAVALRKYLLSDFGLVAIFSYPEKGLFEEVDKGTCVIVGRVKTASDSVKIISCNGLVADIDLNAFEKAISNAFSTDKFAPIAPGIDGLLQSKKHLLSTAKEGWRQICREFDDAISFQQLYICTNDKLVKMKKIDKRDLVRKRGPAGNSGASDLLMMDRNKPFYHKHRKKPKIPAVRHAKLSNLLISDGDTVCFDATKISDANLKVIVDDYLLVPIKESKQQRKEKTATELVALFKTTARKTAASNTVLLPRTIRSKGRVYITEKSFVISTNLFSISMKNKSEAAILASWFSTIFYQLICEINAKRQEGVRKMEVGDIEETYIPNFDKLRKDEKDSLVSEITAIEFLELNHPKIREVDKLWAVILYGAEAKFRLAEARRLLGFLANTRNPTTTSDD